MDLATAEQLASRLIEKMRPFCARAEIAGSIRRRKPEVKDIEIVAIPQWEASDSGLFIDESRQVNRLLQWAFDAEATGDIQWIKPGTHEIIPWEPKRDGKYWRGLLLPHRIKLDLFLTTPEAWGLIFLIRTGSAEFSEAVVTHANRIGKKCAEGRLRASDGEVIETLTELDVFNALNLEYLPPAARTGRDVLRARRI